MPKSGNIDHATLMNAVYRSQRHFYDITRKYYLLGRDRMINNLALSAGDMVLEIGCGTGRNMALIAKRWPGTKLYGLDISSEMLKSAEANLLSAGLVGRFKLAQGDAASFDAKEIFNRNSFDHIVFSYTLSMIPEWQAALQQALQLLAPNGKISVVDFGTQRRLPGWFGKGLRAWLAKFHVSPRAELPQIARALANDANRSVSVNPMARDYCQLISIG